jgi:hypothetical protein
MKKIFLSIAYAFFTAALLIPCQKTNGNSSTKQHTQESNAANINGLLGHLEQTKEYSSNVECFE